jgi:N-acetylneuraminic acid mutarotase
VVWGHQLYVLGGRGRRGPLASVVRYHPAMNAWSELPALPVPVEEPAAGVVGQPWASETLVVTGGLVGGQPSSRSWVRELGR